MSEVSREEVVAWVLAGCDPVTCPIQPKEIRIKGASIKIHSATRTGKPIQLYAHQIEAAKVLEARKGYFFPW